MLSSNQIKLENPGLWTEQFQREAIDMILEGTELEIEYARDTMPRGVLGMNAAMMEQYLQFIANRRLSQLGLPEQFRGVENPFPWMSEIMDLRKEKNFFETRVTTEGVQRLAALVPNVKIDVVTPTLGTPLEPQTRIK